MLTFSALDRVLTFSALDRVDYETLDRSLIRKKNAVVSDLSLENVIEKPAKARHNAVSLLDSAARVIVKKDTLLPLVLDVIPCDLAHSLLRAAIHCQEYYAASILIAEWPQDTLNMRSVYPEGMKSLFIKAVEFGAAVVMGLLRREMVDQHVKLKCLDLQGFQIEEVFSRVLIGSLPILSIPREQRSVETFVEKLMEFLAMEGNGNEAENDSLEEDLRPILQAKVDLFKDGYIHVPKGEKFVVKMDKLKFERNSVKYMEYLIMGALRHMTPYRIEAYNLYVSTNVQENERIIDSCAPFLALLGQDPQILFGLSLSNMEDMLFQYILRGLAPFTKLRALDIGNCSISVTGRTRVRTALRNRIVSLFSTYHDLSRLDLHGSELAGNLSDLLEALPSSLEYLNLSCCSLEHADLNYLSSCKHTASLKELHLSSLVYHGEADATESVLKCIRSFTNLYVLEIQNNDVSDANIQDLCSIISQFKRLKLLDTSYNMFSDSSLWKLVEATAMFSTAECLAISSFPLALGSEQDFLEQHKMYIQSKCKEVLQRCKSDLAVVVSYLGMNE